MACGLDKPRPPPASDSITLRGPPPPKNRLPVLAAVADQAAGKNSGNTP